MMSGLIELGILFFSAFLLLVITIWKRKSPAKVRDLAALTNLKQSLGLSIEDGTRMHMSIGSGSLLNTRGGSALAGLALLRHITERTSVSDQPAVASSGDPILGMLSQDTLQAGYQAAGVDELYVPTTGRVAGLSPFSYAAGAMDISKYENVSANILIGRFGAEVALLTDAADRESIPVIGASDDLVGQAVLFASTQDSLIGEELFTTGAYLGAGASHTASVTVQDILRWLVILALLGGAAAKFLGLI